MQQMQQLAVPRPPMPYGLPQAQAEAEAQQVHAAIMNNNAAMHQMQQAQQRQQARMMAAWGLQGIGPAPGYDINQYLQFQPLDPHADPFQQHVQYGPYDPRIRPPRMNFPAPMPTGAHQYPAYGDQQHPAHGDQQQNDPLNERNRFLAELRRQDRDRAAQR